MLTWATAFAFAQRHGLPMIHWGWSRPSVTRVQRILNGNETWLSQVKSSSLGKTLSYRIKALGGQTVIDPSPDASLTPEGCVYLFKSVPPWQDYFGGFRDQRESVLAALRATIRRGVVEAAQAAEAPVVVAHLRMGDFRAVTQGVDFEKVGLYRTPFAFFENAVAGIRYHAGWEVPVHVVSDGTDAELADLLKAIPNLHRAPRRPALEDLFWMSRAKVIICSAGSTFSSWAGFFGDAALLHHPAHAPVQIRGREFSQSCFDGPISDDFLQWSSQLSEILKGLAFPAR
jgi:hypothetical protein